MSEKKQIRCINCNKVIAEGRFQIKEGEVDLDCRHCGTINVIAAKKPASQPYGDKVALVTK